MEYGLLTGLFTDNILCLITVDYGFILHKRLGGQVWVTKLLKGTTPRIHRLTAEGQKGKTEILNVPLEII